MSHSGRSCRFSAVNSSVFYHGSDPGSVLTVGSEQQTLEGQVAYKSLLFLCAIKQLLSLFVVV